MIATDSTYIRRGDICGDSGGADCGGEGCSRGVEARSGGGGTLGLITIHGITECC